eukprot:SM000056S17987  [mRNA]  locus=s56:559988:563210:+ [translate_table: standard]
MLAVEMADGGAAASATSAAPAADQLQADLHTSIFGGTEDLLESVEDLSTSSSLDASSQHRRLVHSTAAGKLVRELVAEYLEWAELDRTLNIYLPESYAPADRLQRSEMAQALSLDLSHERKAATQKPLLYGLIEHFMDEKALPAELVAYKSDDYRLLKSKTVPRTAVQAAIDAARDAAEEEHLSQHSRSASSQSQLPITPEQLAELALSDAPLPPPIKVKPKPSPHPSPPSSPPPSPKRKAAVEEALLFKIICNAWIMVAGGPTRSSPFARRSFSSDVDSRCIRTLHLVGTVRPTSEPGIDCKH